MKLTLALLVLFAVSLCFVASTPDTLRVGSFGISLIDRFALDNGYFAAQNLAVTYFFVQGSVQQFNSLDSGDYDLITTTGDNVLYRRYNQGRKEYVILAEYDGSPGMWLIGNSNLGITTIQQLEGKTILADSTQSGFVTPLRKLCFDAGIPLPDELLIPLGSLFQRIQILAAGGTNATMSVGSTSIIALANNPQLVLLGDNREHICPYLGSELVGLQSWVANHVNRGKLIRYLKAELQAWQFIKQNRDTVIQFIQTSSSVSNAVATEIYDLTVASRDVGFNDYLVPRKSGIINGMDVRTDDLRITRETCLPLEVELISRAGGLVNLDPLNIAAKEQLQYQRVLQLYKNYPVSPCEQ